MNTVALGIKIQMIFILKKHYYKYEWSWQLLQGIVNKIQSLSFLDHECESSKALVFLWGTVFTGSDQPLLIADVCSFASVKWVASFSPVSGEQVEGTILSEMNWFMPFSSLNCYLSLEMVRPA